MAKNYPHATAHPWHGLALGTDAPRVVTAFIELVPTDTVKFEVDKDSGLLRLDRPQRYSSQCPSLYGFLPQTYCGAEVARCAGTDKGDGDPIDVCVLTERPIHHANFVVRAIPVGGFCLVDRDEADDKLVAVLEGDAVFGQIRDLSEVPRSLLDRLKHYFLSYKQMPGEVNRKVEIGSEYGVDTAHKVINASRHDYRTLVDRSPGGVGNSVCIR
jgi:inorganic pyrophosphatase